MGIMDNMRGSDLRGLLAAGVLKRTRVSALTK